MHELEPRAARHVADAFPREARAYSIRHDEYLEPLLGQLSTVEGRRVRCLGGDAQALPGREKQTDLSRHRVTWCTVYCPAAVKVARDVLKLDTRAEVVRVDLQLRECDDECCGTLAGAEADEGLGREELEADEHGAIAVGIRLGHGVHVEVPAAAGGRVQEVHVR